MILIVYLVFSIITFGLAVYQWTKDDAMTWKELILMFAASFTPFAQVAVLIVTLVVMSEQSDFFSKVAIQKRGKK